MAFRDDYLKRKTQKGLLDLYAFAVTCGDTDTKQAVKHEMRARVNDAFDALERDPKNTKHIFDTLMRAEKRSGNHEI